MQGDCVEDGGDVVKSVGPFPEDVQAEVDFRECVMHDVREEVEPIYIALTWDAKSLTAFRFLIVSLFFCRFFD